MADIKFEDLQQDQEILFEIDVSDNGDWRFVKGTVIDKKPVILLSAIK